MADSLVLRYSPHGIAPDLASVVNDAMISARALARSLAKFPNVHGLATDVLEIAQDIEDLCKLHHALLDESDIVKKVVFGLLRELNSVHLEIGRYLASNPKSVGSWKDLSKTESRLIELKVLANKCLIQITMFTATHADNQLVLAEHSDSNALSVIRHQIAGWISDDRIISFLGVSPESLAMLPPTVSTYYIADAYIRVEIDSIDSQLSDLSSSGSYAIEKPNAAYMAPFQLVLASHTSDDDGAELRQNMIGKIQDVQALIRNDPSMVSIQAGAWKMVNLCNVLDSLDMHQEAASMGLWTVNLFRTLVSTDAKVYSPYLAHSLQRLGYYYTKIKDLDAAEQATREAVVMGRRLYKHSKELEVRTQVVTALKTHANVATLKKDYIKALEHAEEAVRLFEVLIEENRPASHEDGPSHLHLLRTEQEWAEALANFPDLSSLNYSRALQQLSFSLQDNGRAVDAVVPQVKATMVMKFLARYHPDGVLDAELAPMLYRVSHQQFHNFLSLEEALAYSSQGVEIYKKLFAKKANKYGRSLCNALWEQGNILGKLGRHEASVEVWKETASLAKEILEDRLFHADALREVSWNFRRLKRHDDAAAARTESVKVYQNVLGSSSFTEANTHYDLAVDFHLANRYPEAIEAAQMAVTQYRALAFKDSDKYTKNVAKGLNNLTHILSGAKEFDRAFNEGHEALKLYEDLITTDSEVLSEYLRCLRLNSFICLVSEDHHKAVDRILDVVRHSRDIERRFPVKQDEDSVLVRAFQNYSQILSVSLNQLDKAMEVMQEALDYYDGNTATAPKPARQHLECLIDFGSLLDNYGYTEKALGPITKAINVGKPFADNAGAATMTLGAMHRRAQLFLELGRYEEALQSAKDSVDFGCSATLDSDTELIGAWGVLSMSYRYNGRPEDAIVAINEAIKLCHSETFVAYAKIRGYFLLVLPQSLKQLSTNIAFLGKEDEALRIAQQATDMLLDLDGKHLTLRWTEIEPVYMYSLYNLSQRLAANDDLPKALEMIRKYTVYFEERSKTHNGAFTPLACGFLVEGILSCATGQHEEGIAARTKFDALLVRLQKELPGVAHVTQIEIVAETTSAPWVALLAKLKLDCRHQDLECDHSQPSSSS